MSQPSFVFPLDLVLYVIIKTIECHVKPMMIGKVCEALQEVCIFEFSLSLGVYHFSVTFFPLTLTFFFHSCHKPRIQGEKYHDRTGKPAKLRERDTLCAV